MKKRILIEVISEGRQGRVATLFPGQTLRIGRSAWMDLEIPRDAQASAEHLILKAEDHGCRLRDLGSSNGTFVNGKRVAETNLRDEDVVTAGQTNFRIRMEGEWPNRPRRTTVPGKGSDAAIPFTETTCPSGAWRCAGTSPEPPTEVVRRLATLDGLFVVADFNKLEADLPADWSPCWLFDWITPPHSPIVFPWENSPAEFQVISEGWGQDGLVCMLSSADEDAFLHRLRSLIRPEPNRITGYCWPVLLDQILTTGMPGGEDTPFSLASAVLVESPEEQEGWRIYSKESLAKNLAGLKFQQVAESTEEPSQPSQGGS
ncbi:MAG: FHA domain-containing protein [Planctomycetales bacterium]